MSDKPQDDPQKRADYSTRFGGERSNPTSAGGRPQTKIVREALLKVIRENPEAIEKLLLKFISKAESAKDAVAVMEFMRDTLDGKLASAPEDREAQAAGRTVIIQPVAQQPVNQPVIIGPVMREDQMNKFDKSN
jgi:hypothetical protein